MSTANRLSALHQRKSTPSRLLGPPAPNDEELRALIEAALRVPDHGRLQPWRLLAIHGEARLALGQSLVALREARGEQLEPAVRDKDLHRFAQAPLVLAVIARIQAGHKIPQVEQMCSAAALAQNLLIGAAALGYGAQWLTGWPAYDPDVMRLLGLGEGECVVAFIHIGSANGSLPERERPRVEDVFSEWHPPTL